jgi:hypothetical protein
MVPLLAAKPVPETAMLLGEYCPLLVIETQPVNAPVAVGLKVAVAWRVLPGARVWGRVGKVSAKPVLSDAIELTVAFTVPVLVTVSV